ncbi:MAG: hypothetical protein BWY78_00074 [Alphaproteobacteria bacterium ADurb.Bin438]|nr:MAG: hypothetical protein BWY78_00074 [Alphaproteobacteria bacterium ADurb.Bin438]
MKRLVMKVNLIDFMLELDGIVTPVIESIKGLEDYDQQKFVSLKQELRLKINDIIDDISYEEYRHIYGSK